MKTNIIKSVKAGFTLVEIMIVVAIIGLLAAIAIPNFVKAREASQRNACIANLKQIDGARHMWALEHKTNSAPTSLSTLVEDQYLRSEPQCPGGGEYTLVADLATPPSCSLANQGHKLP
jgi:prepilin-type N-terminal cleavage/methylation domain-containing protein